MSHNAHGCKRGLTLDRATRMREFTTSIGSIMIRAVGCCKKALDIVSGPCYHVVSKTFVLKEK
jgi:hypothetical protein